MNKRVIVLALGTILVAYIVVATFNVEKEKAELAQDLRAAIELVETKEVENKELGVKSLEQEKELHDIKEELRILKWVNEQKAMGNEGVTYQNYYEQEGLDGE